MSTNAADARAIIKRYVNSMPTFSPATAKIVQLSNNMNAPANEIVAAIRLDPVLTGKVLQLVNSAYFSLAQKVTSLNRALVYLGINTIKNLALSTAVMEAFDSKNQELADLIKPTWRHCLGTAVCAKILAKTTKVPATTIEEYFIAGLLHDLGQIILTQAFYGDRPVNLGKLSIEQERLEYGLDHCEVGVETLRKWKFSEELVTAIGTYHEPKPENKIANIVHIADAMTYRLKLNGGDEQPEDTSHPVLPSAYETLGLTEEIVLKELAEAPDQIEKAEVFLNIARSTEKVVEKP